MAVSIFSASSQKGLAKGENMWYYDISKVVRSMKKDIVV